MFKGFNLEIEDGYFEDWYSIGTSLHRAKTEVVRRNLDKYFDDDGTISASKVVQSWFPTIKADVFISHSHADSHLAIGMAGWLEDKFGLSAFIDSTVWGYSEKLLEKFDNTYCLNKDRNTYRYKDRNKSTAHVNIMLSSALHNMIDNCESVFFLNTPNSVSCKNDIEGSATHSPWIFSEISITRLIERKAKREESSALLKSEASMEVFAEDMKVKYDLVLDHLNLIDSGGLEAWTRTRRTGVRGPETLDPLYWMFKR